MTPNADYVRRWFARPFHRLAHLLDRMGWWITERPERRRKAAFTQNESSGAS